MLKKNYEFISPNFGNRPEGVVINTIVIHYTEMANDLVALERLCDPAAEVSAHYLINKQGKIFSLVPDNLRAWHAGPSCWREKERVNDYSIGIELDNNGLEEYTSPLMDSLVDLCHELMNNHPIEQRNIVGHSDIIPARKFDPGRLFDWKKLAEKGIGLYPTKLVQNTNIEDIFSIQSKLKLYGYKIELTEELDQLTIDVMRAFNEHFNPRCMEYWDEESQSKLDALMKMI